MRRSHVMLLLLSASCSTSPAAVPERPLRPSTPASNSNSSTASAGTAGSSNFAPADNPGSPIIRNTAGTPGSDGAAGSPLRVGQCARQDVSTTRIVPNIWLVIDGSGSMVSLLDPMNTASPSRWTALREALMDPTNGVVKTLEHDVQFGMIMYDGPIPGNIPIPLPDGGIAMFSSGPATTCPRLVSVEAMKDNFAAIDKAYPIDPLGGSTPTDKALEAVIAHLPNAMQVGPDQVKQPTIVVLATDGEPNDFCSMGFPPDVAPKVLDATKRLVANGNKTYVVSLAGTDPNLMQFCTQVAAAGGTGKPPYVPASRDALIQAFRDIIGPGVACDVKLNGAVKLGAECKGTVQINGADLPCNDPNGWKLKDATTLSIQGASCDKLKTDMQAMLHADFPCEIFTLN